MNNKYESEIMLTLADIKKIKKSGIYNKNKILELLEEEIYRLKKLYDKFEFEENEKRFYCNGCETERPKSIIYNSCGFEYCRICRPKNILNKKLSQKA